MNKEPGKQQFVFICIMLTLLTLAVFEQVRHSDFSSYDDNLYITTNPNVLSGLTFKNIVWAFTHFYQLNWHPLTWLSHMLDCQLFGLNPTGHHLTNLLLHTANVLLLFAILNAMTGVLWRSAFVAALFAIHPLHVQSVAWIAERKDVLSTLFWMLTMGAYLQYVRNPGIKWYLLTLLVFAMGLMAKPMLVTLPFVLLLLDYWPLGRFENISFAKASTRQTFYRLICEKIPLFILTVIASAVTFLAQQSGGVVVKLTNLPLRFRLANSVLSYTKYIGKTIWPTDLAIWYPLNIHELSSGWLLVSLVVLVIISIRTIQFAPKYRYLPVGWFWFIGTLIPVIGIVQVCLQALADRYTYIPLIGLFIIVAWGFNDLCSKKLPYRKVVCGLSAFVVILVLTLCTRIQVGYWRNSVLLSQRALQVTGNNPGTHYNLATSLVQYGRYEDAAEHLRQALLLNQQPDSDKLCDTGDILYNMGWVYSRLGRYQEAVDVFRQAIQIKSDYTVYYELGVAYDQLGNYQQAVEAYTAAVKIKPDYAQAYNNIGVACSNLGRLNEAQENYNKAIRIDPMFADAYDNLGVVLGKIGRYPEAIQAFSKAIQLNPDFAEAHLGLGVVYFMSGDKNSAGREYEILKTIDAQKANLLLGLIKKE